MGIHRTADVSSGAVLGDVEVGPFAVIGDGVELADGVVVGPHAVILGPTRIGSGTQVGSHVVLGGDPQDLKHDGSPTELIIGEDNVFREHATAHRASSASVGATIIGDRNYFMCGTHVAHNCLVGSDCMFANGATIAGHVEIGDRVVLGGMSGVHQFTRIGRVAMIAAGAICTQDIPPFTLAQGDRARLFGLNLVGLRRTGISNEELNVIHAAWRQLFGNEMPLRVAIETVRTEYIGVPGVDALISFIESSRRGIAGANVGRGAT